jgi:uncharacterized DUF497 family protein
MRFEWDGAKNAENLRKHGMSFEVAAEVFRDPLCLTFDDRVVDGEQRLLTMGCLENLVVIVIAHTLRVEQDDEVVRVISARKATARERNFYEEKA